MSNKIENYIPPFFIKYMKYFYNTNNNNEENKINNINEFDDWQSYDLWFLGCIIIEVASNRKPWSDYNFKNNYEFFHFLENSNSLPIIPKKLSNECQELIKILLNPSLTNKKNIYDIIFNLNFFQKIQIILITKKQLQILQIVLKLMIVIVKLIFYKKKI